MLRTKRGPFSHFKVISEHTNHYFKTSFQTLLHITYSYQAPDPTSGVSRGPCNPDIYYGLFHVPDLGTEFDCGFFRLHDWTL
jgi:hypothetical protein